MNSIIITVGTITMAVKVKKLLSAVKIPSKLVKIEAPLTDDGCTHGVEIAYGHYYGAIKELKSRDISYKIYNSGI